MCFELSFQNQALPKFDLDFFPFFLKIYFYIFPLAGEKSSGSRTYYIPLKKAVTFGVVVAVHELRRPCTD